MNLPTHMHNTHATLMHYEKEAARAILHFLLVFSNRTLRDPSIEFVSDWYYSEYKERNNSFS